MVATMSEGTDKIDSAIEAGIRFVQLQFTDIIGHVKAVTIPIHQLAGSVEHGTWFDGSSIEGFTRIAESDQYLMPNKLGFRDERAVPLHARLSRADHGPALNTHVFCGFCLFRG